MGVRVRVPSPVPDDRGVARRELRLFSLRRVRRRAGEAPVLRLARAGRVGFAEPTGQAHGALGRPARSRVHLPSWLGKPDGAAPAGRRSARPHSTTGPTGPTDLSGPSSEVVRHRTAGPKAANPATLFRTISDRAGRTPVVAAPLAPNPRPTHPADRATTRARSDTEPDTASPNRLTHGSDRSSGLRR